MKRWIAIDRRVAVVLGVLVIGAASLPAWAQDVAPPDTAPPAAETPPAESAPEPAPVESAPPEPAAPVDPTPIDPTPSDPVPDEPPVDTTAPEVVAPADPPPAEEVAQSGASEASPVDVRGKAGAEDASTAAENPAGVPAKPARSPVALVGTPIGAAPGAGTQTQKPAAKKSPAATRRAAVRRRSLAARRRAIAAGRAVGGPIARAAATSPGAGDLAAAPVGSAAAEKDASGADPSGSGTPERGSSPVTRTVRKIVEVVPGPVKAALVLLAALSLLLGAGYALAAIRARRLARQRSELLQEVGLLQAALLPPVPSTVGAVTASVAYRPSDGPGAGGDFYDAIALGAGRAAFILGDVSGHGRQALSHTAFMRYTLRAYLEAGLEPRLALQTAERAVGGQLDGDFATVIVAVHDPVSGSLTYACAGHPAPIIIGGARHEPVLTGWSPPIGWGLRTGLRQTTIPLPSGSVACLYTDGLVEAPTEDGLLGRDRLTEIIAAAGREGTAQEVLDGVAQYATEVRDDMAAVLLAPTRQVTSGAFRTEVLEVSREEAGKEIVARFMDECHVALPEARAAESQTRMLADDHGGALVVVSFGVRGARVDVLPRNVESISAAALRRTAV